MTFEEFCKVPVWFCGNITHGIAVGCPDEVVVQLPADIRSRLEAARIAHEGHIDCQSTPPAKTP